MSALQWLCYSDKKDHRSAQRLRAFFTSLYRCLRRGARAALQIYPESPEQLDLISQTAAACGFGGGLVVDFPNSTKAKKYYLCLMAGVDPAAAGATLPRALGGGGSGRSVVDAADDDDVVRIYSSRGAASGAGASAGHGADSAAYEGRRNRLKKRSKKGSRVSVKGKDWVVAAKDARRRKGLVTKSDSKYTARKRSGFRV